LTHFRALKHPIPAMREHFPFPRSFLLAPPPKREVTGRFSSVDA
jgi:hypothetical protein